MKRTLRIATVALLLSAAVTFAQTAVAPPPKPADSGPSLSDTTAFLQQNLPVWGSVSWMATLFNVEARNGGSPIRMTQTLTDLVVSPDGCSLRFTRRTADSFNSMRHLWWTYSFSPPGKQRRDWIQDSLSAWTEINEDGSQGSFQVVSGALLDGIQGVRAINQDNSLTVFIPNEGQPGTYGQWLRFQFSGRNDWINLGKFVEDDRIGNAEISIPFNSVRDIRVAPLKESENSRWASNGHLEVKESIGKPMPVSLLVNLGGNRQIYLVLTEQKSADRAVKAMTHAVELCGSSGNKEPF